MARKKGWKMLSNQSVKALITSGMGRIQFARICRDPIHALAQHQAEQRKGDGGQPDQQPRIDASCLGRRLSDMGRGHR